MTDALLALLRAKANRRGLVLARAEVLTDALKCSYEELGKALEELRVMGRIEILVPLPFLVLALLPRSCSGSATSHAKNQQQISIPKRPLQEEVPVSSAAAAAMQQREVGGAGEGEALLDRVLEALGPEADRDEFARILAGHSAALIERALRRVMATRAIRVSRAALFRSLLARLSH